MGMTDGKTAIVTGGGRGIGRAIAMAFGAAGANVVVNDIGAGLEGDGLDDSLAESVAREIREAGGQAIASTLSITEAENAQNIVQTAMEAFGRVDVVVNNAGILRDRIFHKMSWLDWEDVIKVHLMGSFNLSRAAAAPFRAQESGSYVHMTSTSGLVGNFGQVNYAAGKMGIVGMSRGIALDMARYNVRSNCIAPFAWSRMTSSIPAETPEEKERVARLQQMTPEKIAPLAVFLGSDAASEVSGQIFGMRNNEVMLFDQPRPIRTMQRGDGWTPELLAETLPGAFRSSMTPLERSGDVFSWDPV